MLSRAATKFSIFKQTMKARLALPDGRDPILGAKACASEGVLAAFIRVLGIGNNETNVSFEYKLRDKKIGPWNDPWADGGLHLMLLPPKYWDIRIRADGISTPPGRCGMWKPFSFPVRKPGPCSGADVHLRSPPRGLTQTDTLSVR